MQCLAMAVIASFIGAKGLGFNILLALNGLRIGQAIEQGICIVLIAIVLDRMSLAWANKQTDYFADLTFFNRYKYSLIFLVIVVAGIVLAYIGTFFFPEGFNYLYIVPHNKGITIENILQKGVDWIWDTFFFTLKVFNVFLIQQVLMPMKAAYLSMPVVATLVLTMGIGYIIGGIRSAAIVGGFLLFIALTEWWDRALITMYLMSFAVIVSSIIGVTVGTLCAQNSYTAKFILLVCDTFQTFPSFIYLIPANMHLATLYKKDKNFQKSIDIYNKALNMCYQFCDVIYKQKILISIGEIYIESSDFDKAKRILEKAEGMHNKIGSNSKLIDIKNNLAQVYINQDNFDEARTVLESSKELAESSNLDLKLIFIYKSLSKVHENLNEPEQSFMYNKKHSKLISDYYVNKNKALINENRKTIKDLSMAIKEKHEIEE